MNFSKPTWLNCFIAFGLAVSGSLLLASCVPVDRTPRPTLNEVRSGSARGQIAEDTSLRPGETSAEVVEIDRPRRELRVLTDDGRRAVLAYDLNTRVNYHGLEYRPEDLDAGDRIAFRPVPRDSRYVDVIRIQEPVQARAARSSGRSAAVSPRPDVIEGTVERIDYPLGVFDVRPRAGRTVTVSVPYNARAADVDSFRSLRRGDQVRVEGQFVNPESFQMVTFLSPR
jgi:hypothetical protein